MDGTGFEVGGESRCSGAPLVWFSQEEQLLRRLEEVERFGAKIAGELLKSVPCGGAVSRELLQLELLELKRDRDTLEDKLTLLLSSATFPAPNKGSSYSYETSAGNAPRDIITLRPSPPARAERKYEETLPRRATTISDISDPGVSVTKTITSISCGTKRFPADSEAFVDSSDGSKRYIAQQRPCATSDGLGSSTNSGTNSGTNSSTNSGTNSSSSSTRTSQGRGAITGGSGGRYLDTRVIGSLGSPALVRSGSSNTYGRAAITEASGDGHDLEARTNRSLSSVGLDRTGSSSTHGRGATTAGGGGGRDGDVRTNHNLSGGNGFGHFHEQVTKGRPSDDSYARTHDRTDDSYVGHARTVVVVDRDRRLYNASPAPASRFGTAPSRAGYNGVVGAGRSVGGEGGEGGGRSFSGVSRSVATVQNGDGGGFRVSKWQCTKTSDASARQKNRSDTSRQQQRWTNAPFPPDTGTIAARRGTITDNGPGTITENGLGTIAAIAGIRNPGKCDATAVVNVNTTPTRMALKRPASLGEQGFHEPRCFSSGVRTVTNSSGRGMDRASHTSSASRASSWKGERRDGNVGQQRVKKGPFRAPVDPFIQHRSDLRAGVFNDDGYLASPVSYPPPRPNHHSGYSGYGEQRDYRDTQSVRRGTSRDMSLEEPFSKRKSFRISEGQEGGQQGPCSKRRWPDGPARSSGVDNVNASRGSPRDKFAIHTVPVALSVDAPYERMGEDGRLYYPYSRKGQGLEERRPQGEGEMPRSSYSSNTTQILSERGGGRYELGPTVTPPPFR